ncbi:hypothetical protein [Bacillus sp. B1-b2]|uniref:hypothetical protein n=1 Tax=Bacillus sp. B1-b2 TaxID=2653201 RepID=UPI00132C9649|nr:hypothetical protein [Bacillus sp. B1-b2]KAB7670782.1 hypothetical protein F9279_08180 [Bacillus sp. B1-b2]
MKEKVMEIFVRDIVKNLPRKKKKIYQFIVDIEEDLAKQSKTKKEFMTLLRTQLPHQQAASHFDLSLQEVVTIMEEAEDIISRILDSKIKKYKWMDYTEMVSEEQVDAKKEKNTQYFLCLN